VQITIKIINQMPLVKTSQETRIEQPSVIRYSAEEWARRQNALFGKAA
jgi:hypothetical protein